MDATGRADSRGSARGFRKLLAGRKKDSQGGFQGWPGYLNRVCLAKPDGCWLRFSIGCGFLLSMKLLIALLLAAVSLPAAALCTFLLSPFWNWFEANTGIESIGHSGPADRCFIVVYVLTLLFVFAAWRWLHCRAKN